MKKLAPNPHIQVTNRWVSVSFILNGPENCPTSWGVVWKAKACGPSIGGHHPRSTQIVSFLFLSH